MGSISLNLTDRYQTPYTNAMQDLIIKIFFFFVVAGALLRIAEWIGFMEKDAPEPGERGTAERSQWWGWFFRSLVVLILAFIVFEKYVLPVTDH